MRPDIVATLLVGALAVPHAGSAQTLLKETVQRAKVETSASASNVTAGGAVTLFVDVTPNPSMHIYAEGAKEVTPVALVITPNVSVVAGKPRYPKADMVSDLTAVTPVPAYVRSFRIAVPATIKASAARGDVLTLGGVVNYQACDDRLCYPVSSAPVTWTLKVK